MNQKQNIIWNKSFHLGKLLRLALCLLFIFSIIPTWSNAYAEGETYTVTYDANGGEFEDGTTTNVVTYTDSVAANETKYSHTPNIQDDGTQDGNYAAGLKKKDLVTIEGAEELRVTVVRWGLTSRYSRTDCVYIFEGDYTGRVTGSGSSLGQIATLSGSGSNAEYLVKGDTVTFYFYGESSPGDYGYYAIVTANKSTAVSGAYKTPVAVPTHYENGIRKGFISWNTAPDGSGETIDCNIEHVDSDMTLYAQYGEAVTWKSVGDCEWSIDDDGCIIIRPKNGAVEGTFQYSDYDYRRVPWRSYTSEYKNTITSVKVLGNVHFKSAGYLFYKCPKLKTVDFSTADFDQATNMSYMFSECSSLESVDFGSFDTSKVTNMSYMFNGCSSLTSIPTELFDTHLVTNMDHMFNGCSSLSVLDISSFNTENVTNMNYTFACGAGLTSIDTSGIDTSSVTSMAGMFANNKSLSSVDLSNFDTSNVTTMASMFRYCQQLSDVDLSQLETDRVTDMSYMFSYCNVGNVGISDLNTSHTQIMKLMFCGSNMAGADLTNMDTGSATDMSSMFYQCTGMDGIDLSGFNTSNVTDMNSMFCKCEDLTEIDVSSFDTSNVTNFKSMFSDCTALRSLDLHTFNTSSGANFSTMFWNCPYLNTLDIGSFDTRNATNLQSMLSPGPAFANRNLSSVTIGENFRFYGNQTDWSRAAKFPEPNTTVSTGKWIKIDETAGPLTAQALGDQYDANAGSWAGTWVWEEIPVAYTLVFKAPDSAVGDMPKQKIVAAEDGTINPVGFRLFNHTFDHWSASDGSIYADGATIPANTYAIGDVITLTAVFVENENKFNMENGEFEIELHAGETATFNNLPAGTAYQVWEETPEGWVLIEQRNVSGTIEPLQTAEAFFKNLYQPGVVSVQFIGSKTLEGRAADEGMFSFELSLDGEVLQTKSNEVGGFIQFDAIELDTEGVYVYKVKEVIGDDPMVDYDLHEETITVVVEKGEDDKLHATVTYDDDGIRFANRKKPGVLMIVKNGFGAFEGSADAEFTFKVTLENENGFLYDGNYYWYILDGDGNVINP